jgi:hypothetical protein
MIAKILIALAVLIVVFLIVAAFQPEDFRVERSITISAPAALAFDQVNDLHKWQEMSPYAKLDLATKYTFTGPSAGPDAALAWVGNSKVGEGKMTITESRPNELVKMRLDFEKPFKSTCEAEFTFKPAGDQTTVMWGMSGKKIFVTKAMGLIMSMDKMVGGQFEEGLANLKTIAEAKAKK